MRGGKKQSRKKKEGPKKKAASKASKGVEQKSFHGYHSIKGSK